MTSVLHFCRRRSASLFAGLFGLALAVCAIVALLAWRRSPRRGLPYHDSFAAGKADEWKAFGGTWELADGGIRNDSDERGAKLVTGSPWWRNYTIEADVYLLGVSGDAGLLIRSSKEEEGVNAYSGYYAGVRTSDNSLVLGRADHGWQEETQRYPVANGIHPFQWYHLKLVAVGCEIAVSVGTTAQHDQTAFGISDPQCIASGRAGLRSYSSGSIWRNVFVRPATHQDIVEMLRKGSSHEPLLANTSEALSPNSPEALRDLEREQGLDAPVDRNVGNTRAQSIHSLLLASSAKPVRAMVRGVVVLTTPRLYVQDSSGGMYVSQYSGPPLRVGDDVEVRGEVHPGNFSSRMDHSAVQLLWGRSPVPPLSVTALQASTGRYDSTFIELHGLLTAKSRGPNDKLILDLNDGSQSFRAILNPGRSGALLSKLQLNSLLRLRGICVSDPSLTHNLTPFVLLLPSNEDLDVISGPPWWSTGHILALGISTALLAIISVILYHRIVDWRLRAILDERSRLAHEMHDTLAQSFAGIGFQLQAISNGVPKYMSQLHEQVELARDLVRHSHEEARRSIATLRAEALESEDVLGALEHCARRIVGNHMVVVATETQGDRRQIPLRTKDTLFRIGQEAVANAIRHAESSRISLRMVWADDKVTLYIEDDGIGFDPGSTSSGFGIRGMRRRAHAIAATLHIVSRAGAGASVWIEAPLPPRVTLASWPRILWKSMMEAWRHARTARTIGSHLYRG